MYDKILKRINFFKQYLLLNRHGVQKLPQKLRALAVLPEDPSLTFQHLHSGL